MTRRLFFLLLVTGMVWPQHLHAKNSVTGRYQGAGSDQVTIQLVVSDPAPMAFIVLQRLPKGVRLLSASPNPSGGTKGATVKWLFKHARPGNHTVVMRLSMPVAPGQLQGEIRFRHPDSGAMITTKINT